LKSGDTFAFDKPFIEYQYCIESSEIGLKIF